MKVLFKFDNGMELSLDPSHIQLIDNGGKETVAIARTDNAVIPLIFFKQFLATEDELKARRVAASIVKSSAEQERRSITQLEAAKATQSSSGESKS